MKSRKISLFFMALLMSCYAMAQQALLTGRVVDANDGSAIIGVSIKIQGTSGGTITDIDGNYSLKIPSSKVTLTFSSVGYTSQNIAVKSGQKVLNVSLRPETKMLEDVVVVGYGTMKKKLVNGANLNVKGEEISKLNAATAMEALQGVAAGVSITRNNGSPGAGTKVNIRGMGTIGNSSPLYIVDGVAVGDINYLNSSDIESIDVLKDAASSAIYGSRAANGVILVTTKKGKRSTKATVSYDGYWGVQNIYKKLPSLNAQQYMLIMDESRANDGVQAHDWEAEIKNNPWLDEQYPGQNLGTALGTYVWDKLQAGWKGTDWVDEMTKKDAPIQSHSINITGGQENVIYALGFSYFNQDGVIGGDLIGASYRRLTARMNTEMILWKNKKFDILKVGENMTYTNTRNKGVATGNIYWNDLHNALTQNPLMPAYWDQSHDAMGFTPTLQGLAKDQHNPLASMYYGRNFNWGKGNNITGNVYAELQPIKDLKFRSSFGITAWFGHSRSWTPTHSGIASNFDNLVDGVSMSMYQGINYTWTNTLSYKYIFGDHSIEAMVGSEMMKNGLNMNVSGSKVKTLFGTPENAYLDNANKTDITGIDTGGKDWGAVGGGLMSYMSRISYNYKDRYMADFVFRADGSSNFAKGHRWGTFPSVSLGWNFTEENFMKNIPVINYGKLRASWGQNGNQAIDNFIYTSNIAYLKTGYFFGDTKPVSGATGVPANVPNKDVSWEKSEQLNIGLDLHLLNSRMSITLDWYKKTTKDWLVVAPILGTSGAGAPYINGGDIQNKGFELTVGWNDHIGDFKYGVTLSGSHNNNKVTRIANAEGIITGPSHVLSQGTSYISRVEVGQPIGYFYGYKADGILQNQEEVNAYVGPEGNPYFADQRPGDVRFVDQNKDGVIDDKDKVKLGKPNPDFDAGFQLNMEYKGFYAYSTLTGKFGMQVMQSYRSFADQFTQNYTTDIFGRWHGEGTSNRLPRLSSSSHRNTNFISDIYMHNADYVRVTNLTVGYDFQKLLKKYISIQSAKLYMSVNNLCTFTKYNGMDPDVAFGHDANWASGIDLGLYPLPRTVIFGVSVTF
jgi:TonB-linked SusC/RagA family outer membrane protein